MPLNSPLSQTDAGKLLERLEKLNGYLLAVFVRSLSNLIDKLSLFGVPDARVVATISLHVRVEVPETNPQRW
jgi:hypothetical protein